MRASMVLYLSDSADGDVWLRKAWALRGEHLLGGPGDDGGDVPDGPQCDLPSRDLPRFPRLHGFHGPKQIQAASVAASLLSFDFHKILFTFAVTEIVTAK